MEQMDIVNTIKFIRPNANFRMVEKELDWLDEEQIKPTKKEIESGWIDYKKAQTIESETKAATKAALLDRLGITEDEAKLLLA
jgi:hypothetical protein